MKRGHFDGDDEIQYQKNTQKRLENYSVSGEKSSNPELFQKCRIWVGALKNGYGQINYHKKICLCIVSV